MKMMRAFLLVAALTGCATLPAGSVSRDRQALDQELAALNAGPPRSCISGTDRNLVIGDEQTVVQREGPTTWVNRLATACPGLRPINTLVVERYGSQLCRGDRIRSLEPGSSIPGPICVLGDFTPYTRR